MLATYLLELIADCKNQNDKSVLILNNIMNIKSNNDQENLNLKQKLYRGIMRKYLERILDQQKNDYKTNNQEDIKDLFNLHTTKKESIIDLHI